ncbi:aldo/keto reductase [Deminuibacter soli]|uniref:Aldo/keto reductase n=1 Tax=Deminuibacter soli TaxID=2291815 RepID=A0A3E1NIJ7_9BACT|nr:aldo/keto reductase [Deminuibacter soli]RFM27742.1 aldo/keto reductase [Deminuibacter soli]
MQQNRLGKSDLYVSEISFGCMSLGSDMAVNEAITGKAMDAGINLFDTADLYNQSENERMLGKLLKGRRRQAIIATKAGNQWRSDGSGWDWNPRKEYILKAADESLRRLQTDYIDLYQLHGGTINDPMDDTIEAFERLKEQGKIRWYGISSIRPNVIAEYLRRSSIVSVMMQYSLLDRRPEESCLALLQQHEVSVLARGSVAKGLLAGKPAAAYNGYEEQAVAAAAKAIGQLAVQLERSAAQTAAGYVLQQPVATAVLGIRTLQQLNDMVDGKGVAALSAAQKETLQHAVKPVFYTEHR